MGIDTPSPGAQTGRAWRPVLDQGGVHIYTVPADRSQARTFNAGAARDFQWSPDGKRFALSTGDGIPYRSFASVRSSHPPGGGGGADAAGHVQSEPRWQVPRGGGRRRHRDDLGDCLGPTRGQRIPGHPAPAGLPHIPTVRAVSALLWSPDAKRLAGFRWGDNGLWVWEVATGRLLSSFAFGSSFQPFSSGPPPIVWSRDSQFLLAVVTSPRVRVLDVTAGKQVREWAADTSFSNYTNLIAWGPTDQMLTTGIGNPPRVQIWDVKTGEKDFAFEKPIPELEAISWSPDGRRLVKLLREICEIYDRNTRRSVSFRRPGLLLAWKPDGSQLAFFGNTAVDSTRRPPGLGLPARRECLSGRGCNAITNRGKRCSNRASPVLRLGRARPRGRGRGSG